MPTPAVNNPSSVFCWDRSKKRERLVFRAALLLFGFCIAAGIMLPSVRVPESQVEFGSPGTVTLLPIDKSYLQRQFAANALLPLSGPVWADPVAAGPIEELNVPVPLQSTPDSPLEFLEPQRFAGVADQLRTLWEPPAPGFAELMNDGVLPDTACVPYLSFYSPALDGYIVTATAPATFAKQTDYTGLRSEFFVVVNPAGVPEQVLVLNPEELPQADHAATQFVRSLRWPPAALPRTGTMLVEWQKERNE